MGLGFSVIIVEASVFGIKNGKLDAAMEVVALGHCGWCQQFRKLFFSLILSRMWSGMDENNGRKGLKSDALSMVN